jgi:anti-anti-sigma regulatory factor
VKRGGRIILVNLEKQLEDLFTITKLSFLFEIATSYEQALADFLA